MYKNLLKLACLKINEADEFIEFQELLEWMQAHDQEKLEFYLYNLTSEQSNSLMELR